MTGENKPEGLDGAYGAAPTDDRKVTGDPNVPPAAATGTLGDLRHAEADARARQAGRAAGAQADDAEPEAHPS